MKFITPILALLVMSSITIAQTKPATKPAKPKPPPPAVEQTKEGKLRYVTYQNGDRVPDFSYAGYAAANMPIPTVPAKVVAAAPVDGDNTRALQAAIDQVAKLPLDKDGFRGAVLVPPGQYKVAGSLKINASGVVLRGSGFGKNGTTLIATGQDRRALVHVVGVDDRQYGSSTEVADDFVPIGAMQLKVTNASSFKVGDSITIRRASTDAWAAALKMDDLGGGPDDGPRWKADSREITWDRAIKQIDGNTITLDAPITMAIESRLGGAKVASYTWPGRVMNVGVENLAMESTVDIANPKDEDHAWYAVGVDNARDAWVRQVTASKFAGSAVAVWNTSSRVTVEDCKSLSPVSEIGGLRRYSFLIAGQQVLMQRLYSEDGFHDFAVGYAAAGPNAFVQVESVRSLGESGGIESATTGMLFDRARIDRQALTLRNRGYIGQGIGWTAFGSVLWNCSAPLIECWNPPGSRNWAFGACGEFAGDGIWSGTNDDVNPDSLYYAQLRDRVGEETAGRAFLVLPPVQGSRAPTLESAAEAIRISYEPRVSMDKWIDEAPKRTPIPTDTAGLATAQPSAAESTVSNTASTLAIKNGWLVFGDKLATGGSLEAPWWNGGIRPNDIAQAKPSLTRFVPGRSGIGFTDDIQTVAAGMALSHRTVYQQYPPLWYERRRDDHERTHRIDGEVVAPFYEWPYARSGQDSAFDGLSKWDLTKLNPWYFDRLQQFSRLAAQHDLVLLNGHYMQHNILEAGGHYADFPWKTSNNINNPGFPEPVFFAGDKLIYVAEQFYDVTDSHRAELHRNYIRKALDAIGDKPNVITYLSEEYTGPLAFTQFWIDTIGQWEKETGRHVMVALYAPKDVQDAILTDADRAKVVDLIYNRYGVGNDAGWWYQPDGTLYAPVGGKNLSPRQWERLNKPKNPSFAQVARAVREYRLKYPDKPFYYAGEFGWASLIGGGSMPNIPKLDDNLAMAIPTMHPADLPNDPKGQWLLADAGKNYLVYNDSGGKISVDLTRAQGKFAVRWIEPRKGEVSDGGETVDGGSVVTISSNRSSVLWLTR